jgi:glutamyl/glutaminyl-tRNA synthetase
MSEILMQKWFELMKPVMESENANRKKFEAMVKQIYIKSKNKEKITKNFSTTRSADETITSSHKSVSKMPTTKLSSTKTDVLTDKQIEQ